MNRCIEGRCETLVPNLGVAVVSEGDVCMSASQVLPDAFSYPLSRYRGVELFVNTNVANEREFCLLEEAGVSLDELACKADFAAVFSGDARLQSLMDRAVRAARAGEMAMAKLELLSIFMELGRRDFSLTRPVAFLTRTQLEIARRAHDEVKSALAATHDARDIASRMGVSATTLNGCFAKLYGMTIAAYARRRRMERARESSRPVRAFLPRPSRSATATPANSPPPSNAKPASRLQSSAGGHEGFRQLQLPNCLGIGSPPICWERLVTRK